MMKSKGIIILFFILIFQISAQEKQSLQLNGQLSTWAIAGLNDPVVIQPGFRFVPALTGKFTWQNQQFIDMEASLNFNGKLTFEDFQLQDSSLKIKPYRVWFRYANEQFEIRAGLQKINFGSAKLFRPLMWFDAMDVRDPLQLTDGVYGILAKYFFDNNANLWLWGLMGNKNPKGFELFGSSPLKPEFGGRVETPLGPGEIGLSYHHRTLREDLNRLNFVLGKNEHQENRIGFNGKWDVGVGVWVESSISFVSDNLISNYHIPGMTDMLNVGIDYTIPVGNGLGATFEYFRYHTGDYLFKYGVDAQVFGSMLTYPLNESDNLSAMIFYIPSDQPAWLNYVSWTRSYDNWSIYGIAFWNPETYNLPTFQSDGRNMFGGKGVQIMLTYNF